MGRFRAIGHSLPIFLLTSCGLFITRAEDLVFACRNDLDCAVEHGYTCIEEICAIADPVNPRRDGGIIRLRDGGSLSDAGFDTGVLDAGFDAGSEDAGINPTEDAGSLNDAGFDTGVPDAGDAGFDAGSVDAGPPWEVFDRDGDGILNGNDLLEAVDVDGDGNADTLCIRNTLTSPWRGSNAYRQGASPVSYGGFEQVNLALEDAVTAVPGAPAGITEWCYSFLGEQATNYVYRLVSKLGADGVNELDDTSKEDCSAWIVSDDYVAFCGQFNDTFCSGFTYGNACGTISETIGVSWDGVEISGI